MQPAIDCNAVVNFNGNAPTIAKESFRIGPKTVTVEIYFDYYGTDNARVLIDGVCEDANWNGDFIKCQFGDVSEWNLYGMRSVRRGFPYPRGLAQYKFRDRIAELACRLWKQHWIRCSPGRREVRGGTLVFQTKSQALDFFQGHIPGATSEVPSQIDRPERIQRHGWRGSCRRDFIVLDPVE
jgi:hypothetical protein